MLRRAYRAMQRHLKQEWGAREPGVPYQTPYDALTMASIIEKETGQAGERDMIAGVLVNRLRIGMRLQVDPTIIYGLGAAFNGNLKRTHLSRMARTTPTRASACRRRRSPCPGSPRCAPRCGREKPTRVLRLAQRRLEPVLPYPRGAQPRRARYQLRRPAK